MLFIVGVNFHTIHKQVMLIVIVDVFNLQFVRIQIYVRIGKEIIL